MPASPSLCAPQTEEVRCVRKFNCIENFVSSFELCHEMAIRFWVYTLEAHRRGASPTPLARHHGAGYVTSMMNDGQEVTEMQTRKRKPREKTNWDSRRIFQERNTTKGLLKILPRKCSTR